MAVHVDFERSNYLDVTAVEWRMLEIKNQDFSIAPANQSLM